MPVTQADAARLLAVTAAYDRRTVGQVDAQAWSRALSAHPFDATEYADAIHEHHAQCNDWLMPAHLAHHARLRRRRALEARRNAEVRAAAHEIAARAHEVGESRRAQIQSIRQQAALPAEATA